MFLLAVIISISVISSVTSTESQLQTSASNIETEEGKGSCFRFRVVGGINATKDDYPPLVSLSYRSGTPFCGGTAVHKKWVLTAAHCVDRGSTISYRVQIGFINLTPGKPSEPGEANFDIEKRIVHPKFDPKTLKEDVALIKIKGEFKSHTIATVQDKDFDMSGLDATALGWGRTNDSDCESKTLLLQKVTQKICNKDWKVKGRDYEKLRHQVICHGLNSGRGICRGDSGSPLIIGQEKITVGVASFTPDCMRGEFFQKVSRHVDWIERTIGAKLIRADYSAGGQLRSNVFWFWFIFAILLVATLNLK